MDFPRAWAISRGTTFFRHDSKCSYVIHKGALLCDCHVLTQHPEYLKDYGKPNDLSYRQKVSMDSLLSVLGKITNILSRINEGGYMGDIEQYIDEVQNDLSEMQDQD